VLHCSAGSAAGALAEHAAGVGTLAGAWVVDVAVVPHPELAALTATVTAIEAQRRS
jgi:hypothetical protein